MGPEWRWPTAQRPAPLNTWERGEDEKGGLRVCECERERKVVDGAKVWLWSTAQRPAPSGTWERGGGESERKEDMRWGEESERVRERIVCASGLSVCECACEGESD
jgi:hypothetical protein